MPGIKHLIECHCTLKIYGDSINHKFPVYSKLDDQGNVIKKIAKCNNCEALHAITDMCTSELLPGKDQTSIVASIDEVSLSLPERLVNILHKLECDISSYEHCLDVIEESRWGETVVLRRDIIEEKESLKVLSITGENKFKIGTKLINSIVRVD